MVRLRKACCKRSTSSAGTIFDDDYPKKESAAGIVSDAMFLALVQQASSSDTIYGIITPGFFQRAYPALMEAVADSPEAFIRGKGDHVLLGQEFLTEMMTALRPGTDAQRPKSQC